MRLARICVLTAFTMATLSLSAQPVAALAAYIHVNTTSDADDGADGLCSIREAIIASNVGGGYKDCTAGTTGTDTILFDVSSINVTSQLPTATVPVFINGAFNGSRAALHGSAGSGLILQGSGTSTVRNLVIEGFGAGITSTVSTLVVTGNVIDNNLLYGVRVASGSVTIGGSNSGSPNPCSDDCNVITRNGQGISWESATGSITGNFIGVDSTGTTAAANAGGIYINGASSLTIGGTTAAARNVVSGNGAYGMSLYHCTCTVEGNYVGTTMTGNAALANGNGIEVQASQVTIGGTAGAGNVISGNVHDGIYSNYAVSPYQIYVYGNMIGTKANGTGALGNGRDGIHFVGPAGPPSVDAAAVGDAGGPNVIAYNTGAGVHLDGPTVTHTHIRANSIHDNGGLGIYLEGSANEGIAAPAITGLTPVHGTACQYCQIDVFSDSADEGRIYEGTTIADSSGVWSYPDAVTGPKVTVTATDNLGNTSQFSGAVSLINYQPDGRIRTGKGTLIGNNIYNTTGTNQTKTASKAPGTTVKFGISIQNDSAASDHFSVAASGQAITGYAVKYFRGTTDITAAVVGGTYTTPVLSPGSTLLITAKVKVKSTAAAGSSVTRLVTLTSVGDGTKKDAVKFIVSRS
jgi:CSLREA domain-containing protein